MSLGARCEVTVPLQQHIRFIESVPRQHIALAIAIITTLAGIILVGVYYVVPTVAITCGVTYPAMAFILYAGVRGSAKKPYHNLLYRTTGSQSNAVQLSEIAPKPQPKVQVSEIAPKQRRTFTKGTIPYAEGIDSFGPFEIIRPTDAVVQSDAVSQFSVAPYTPSDSDIREVITAFVKNNRTQAQKSKKSMAGEVDLTAMSDNMGEWNAIQLKRFVEVLATQLKAVSKEKRIELFKEIATHKLWAQVKKELVALANENESLHFLLIDIDYYAQKKESKVVDFRDLIAKPEMIKDIDLDQIMLFIDYLYTHYPLKGGEYIPAGYRGSRVAHAIKSHPLWREVQSTFDPATYGEYYLAINNDFK